MNLKKSSIFPTFWQAIILLVFLILILIFNESLAVWIGLDPKEVAVNPLINAIVNLLGFGLIIRLGFLRTGAAFQEVFPFRRTSARAFAAVLLSVAGLQIIGSELDNILRTLSPVFQNNSLRDLFENGNPETLILFVVFLGPIYEEFLFRGLLLYGFSRNYGKTKAILLTACLFGLMHLDPARIIFAGLFGIVLAWVALDTGSLWPSLFGHVWNNAMPFLMGLMPWAIPGFNRPGLGKIIEQPLWFDLLGIGLVGSGVFLLFMQGRAVGREKH